MLSKYRYYFLNILRYVGWRVHHIYLIPFSHYIPKYKAIFFFSKIAFQKKNFSPSKISHITIALSVVYFEKKPQLFRGKIHYFEMVWVIGSLCIYRSDLTESVKTKSKEKFNMNLLSFWISLLQLLDIIVRKFFRGPVQHSNRGSRLCHRVYWFLWQIKKNVPILCEWYMWIEMNFYWEHHTLNQKSLYLKSLDSWERSMIYSRKLYSVSWK